MNKFRQQNKLSIIKIAIIMVLLLMLVSFFRIDSSRIQNRKNPIFAMNLIALKDGGSRYFIGIGYGVIVWKQLAQINSSGKLIDGFNIGIEIVRFPECYTIIFTNSFSPSTNLEFVVAE